MKKTILLSIVAASFLFGEDAVFVMDIEKQAIDTPVATVDANPTSTTTLGGDTASMLGSTAGVSINTGGGISSLPSIHGMADDRVKTEIDGMKITSACPNHMNPALSYIDPSKVGVIEAIAGITPVSLGGDSIGGSIIVKSKDPVFAKDGQSVLSDFEATGFYKSNNHDRGLSTAINVANDKISFNYSRMAEKSNDYKDGSGNTVKVTLFQHENQSAALSYKLDSGVVTLKVGHQNVPYEGFVNQYMDMLGNDSTNINLSYKGKIGSVLVDANVFKQDTSHYMNKIYYYNGDQINVTNAGYYERGTGGAIGAGMPMYTKAKEEGYKFVAEIPLSSSETIKLGSDLDKYTLNDWWTNANTGSMRPYSFVNINNGHRDVLGFFAEDLKQWNEKISTNFGARINIVTMNTGSVQGYNTGAGTYAGVTITAAQSNDPIDAAAFNALDHSKRDINLDLTALTQYKNSSTNDLEFGLSQKTRSPSLYERYTWAGGYQALSTGLANIAPLAMDMRMVNWFGDGNGYVGNLSLKPETAYTASASSTWHDEKNSDWKIKVTPYYTFVKDYIDTNLLVTYNGINYLQFANHDAVLFGADVSAEARAWSNDQYGKGLLKCALTYTRGYRTDSSGSGLYHIMPINANIALEQSVGNWTNSVNIQAVGAKNETDNTRKEPTTPGYALVDLKTNYKFSKNVNFDFSITNLFDKSYALPLGGIDLVDHSANTYTPLAGMGRSFNTALNIKF